MLPNQKRTPNSKTGTRRGPIFSKKGTLTTLEDPKLEFFGIVHKELICGRPATSFQEWFVIPTSCHTCLSSPWPPSGPRSCWRAIISKVLFRQNAHPFLPCPQPNSHYHPILPPHPPPSRPASPHQQLCLIINNQKGDAAMVLKYIETSASEYLAGHPQSQSPNCDPWNYTSLTKSQISNHWMSTLSVEQLERNKGGV